MSAGRMFNWVPGRRRRPSPESGASPKGRRNWSRLFGSALAATGVVVLIAGLAAPAASANPTPQGHDNGSSSGSLTYTGQGIKDDGKVEQKCGAEDDPLGANAPYLLFLFTGGSATDVQLHGITVTDTKVTNGAVQFVTPYVDPSSLINQVYVAWSGDAGKNPQLTISHGCAATDMSSSSSSPPKQTLEGSFGLSGQVTCDGSAAAGINATVTNNGTTTVNAQLAVNGRIASDYLSYAPGQSRQFTIVIADLANNLPTNLQNYSLLVYTFTSQQVDVGGPTDVANTCLNQAPPSSPPAPKCVTLSTANIAEYGTLTWTKYSATVVLKDRDGGYCNDWPFDVTRYSPKDFPQTVQQVSAVNVGKSGLSATATVDKFTCGQSDGYEGTGPAVGSTLGGPGQGYEATHKFLHQIFGGPVTYYVNSDCAQPTTPSVTGKVTASAKCVAQGGVVTATYTDPMADKADQLGVNFSGVGFNETQLGYDRTVTITVPNKLTPKYVPDGTYTVSGYHNDDSYDATLVQTTITVKCGSHTTSTPPSSTSPTTKTSETTPLKPSNPTIAVSCPAGTAVKVHFDNLKGFVKDSTYFVNAAAGGVRGGLPTNSDKNGTLFGLPIGTPLEVTLHHVPAGTTSGTWSITRKPADNVVLSGSFKLNCLAKPSTPPTKSSTPQESSVSHSTKPSSQQPSSSAKPPTSASISVIPPTSKSVVSSNAPVSSTVVASSSSRALHTPVAAHTDGDFPTPGNSLWTVLLVSGLMLLAGGSLLLALSKRRPNGARQH